MRERIERRSFAQKHTRAKLRTKQVAATPSPLVGEGWGGGSRGYGTDVPHSTTPTPDPSPQGGGEEFAALLQT
jgi:hypothetical protein